MYMYVLVHGQGSMRVEHSVIRNFNIQDECLPRKNVKGDSFFYCNNKYNNAIG